MPMPQLEPPPGFRGAFRTDDDARAVYAEAAGIMRIDPLAVAVPEHADDVGTVVRWAHATRTPLVPRGSGSSMGGGAIGRGVVVDLSRIAEIGEVDERHRTIRVGPGVLRDEVDRRARQRGLRFPVDPSSGAFCTVGGMVGTNAAGAHTLRFGSMRHWVRALDCVFEDGTRAEVRRGAPPPRHVAAVERFLRDVHPALVADAEREHAWHGGVMKDSSGYAVGAYARSLDLVDLLVGSEGTLAVFVGIELDLISVAGATSSVLGAFASLDAAVAAAGRARQTGAVACELLERTFADTVQLQAPAFLPHPADRTAPAAHPFLLPSSLSRHSRELDGHVVVGFLGVEVGDDGVAAVMLVDEAGAGVGAGSPVLAP